MGPEAEPLAEMWRIHARINLYVLDHVDEGALADRLAPSRELRLDVERAGGLVEVRAELATGAFAAAGVEVWLPARASFHDEAGRGG